MGRLGEFKNIIAFTVFIVGVTISSMTFFVTRSAFAQHSEDQKAFNDKALTEVLKLKEDALNQKLLAKTYRDLDHYYNIKIDDLTEWDKSRIRELEAEVNHYKGITPSS